MNLGRWLWYAILLGIVAYDFFYNVPRDLEDEDED